MVTGLVKLNRSLMANFVQMIAQLARNPRQTAKADDIRTLVVNMYYLLNELRPFQAACDFKTVVDAEIDEQTRFADAATQLFFGWFLYLCGVGIWRLLKPAL
jgi:hypothetical protein